MTTQSASPRLLSFVRSAGNLFVSAQKIPNARAYINGFPTEDDGTIVCAYDAATFGTSEAKLLWEGRPGKDGLVHFDLSHALIEKQLQLTAIGGRSKIRRYNITYQSPWRISHSGFAS